jgi:hypothetical protein
MLGLLLNSKSDEGKSEIFCVIHLFRSFLRSSSHLPHLSSISCLFFLNPPTCLIPLSLGATEFCDATTPYKQISTFIWYSSRRRRRPHFIKLSVNLKTKAYTLLSDVELRVSRSHSVSSLLVSNRTAQLNSSHIKLAIKCADTLAPDSPDLR